MQESWRSPSCWFRRPRCEWCTAGRGSRAIDNIDAALVHVAERFRCYAARRGLYQGAPWICTTQTRPQARGPTPACTRWLLLRPRPRLRRKFLGFMVP